MSASKEGPEETAKESDPFTESTDEATRYVIDRWGYVGDKIVIEGRVTELSSTITLKRMKYQSDAIDATLRLEPKNLKCDLVIDKPITEIEETGDDLAIVGLVFRRFNNELAMQAQQVMVEHLGRMYPDEPPESRVSAGERRTKDRQSVEF